MKSNEERDAVRLRHGAGRECQGRCRESKLEVRKVFEPWVELYTLQRFSKPPLSATQPPHRVEHQVYDLRPFVAARLPRRGADNVVCSGHHEADRCSAGFFACDRLCAVLMSAMCENACGKLPTRR